MSKKKQARTIAMDFDGNWRGVVEKIYQFLPYWYDKNPAPAEIL